MTQIANWVQNKWNAAVLRSLAEERLFVNVYTVTDDDDDVDDSRETFVEILIIEARRGPTVVRLTKKKKRFFGEQNVGRERVASHWSWRHLQI